MKSQLLQVTFQAFMRSAMYREISLLMAQMRRIGATASAKRLGLVNSSLYEYKVLMRLVHDTEVPQHELAFDAAMDKAAVSRLVRDLVADGIVSVRVHPDDKRQRLVKLTPKGRAKEAMLTPIVDEALAPFMGGLNDHEAREFLRLLRKACEATASAARELCLFESATPSLPPKAASKSSPPKRVSARAPRRRKA